MVLCDTISIKYLSTDHILHHRSKHIDIDVHFVKKHVELGFLRLVYVKSYKQIKNLFQGISFNLSQASWLSKSFFFQLEKG